MGMKIIEDRPTPPEVYNWKIYTTGLIISCGALLFGYASTFIGLDIATAAFSDAFGLTGNPSASKIKQDIVSLFQAGAFFGAILSYVTMEKFGRRTCLQVATVFYFIGSLFQTVATHQLALIYVGRIFVGLGVGMVSGVCPVYLAEISPPAIRGRLVGFFEISTQVGSLVGFWVNYGLSQHMSKTDPKVFRIPFALELIPSGILFVGSFFIIESPRYLLKKDKPEIAIKNLTWLRNLHESDQYIGEELNAVALQIDREREVTAGRAGSGMAGYFKGIWGEVSAKGIRNRMFIGFMVMMFQNMSGINAINYYSSTLFTQIGITQVSLYSGVFGVLKAAASIVFFIWIVDLVPRRYALMFGATLSGVCLIFVGGYIKIGRPQDGNLSVSTMEGGKAATAAILLFGVFYSFGWNGLAWVICAEIYPLRIRGFCSAWTACCQWLFQWIIAYTTPLMSVHLGWGMFLLFGLFNFASVIYVLFFVPETKGKTLEDMDQVFGYEHSKYLASDSEFPVEVPTTKQEPQVMIENTTKPMVEQVQERSEVV